MRLFLLVININFAIIKLMFETKISDIKLNSYIFNASGPNNSTFKELEIIAKSDSSAIMMKSCTIESRKGNLKFL